MSNLKNIANIWYLIGIQPVWQDYKIFSFVEHPDI